MKMPWEDDINWGNTATTIVKGEPMEIYSGHEGKDRVCCNCRHNTRTPQKTYIECKCDIDGHRIGYTECFDCWCRRWTRERRTDDTN